MKLSIPETVSETVPWSRYQEDIFAATREGTDNLLVQAVAGSGKTTTLLECMRQTPNNKQCGFVAFNRSIADELAGRVPPHVTSKTFHSTCFSVLRNMGYKLWKTKTKVILEELCDSDNIDKEIFYEILVPCRRIIGLLKGNILEGRVDLNDIMSIAKELGLPVSTGAAQYILRVWDRNFVGKYGKIVDFDDMLRVPLLQNLELPSYDVLFVDEAQDLNRIQHKLVQKMLKKNGRIIAVGDRHQAIYGFRGASCTSMDDMSEIFNMKELPLSVSYRCSVEVKEQAMKFNPSILCRMAAPRGLFDPTLYQGDFYKMAFDMRESHMVLGRYNYSLFRTALRMRLYHQPVYLTGRDVVPVVKSVAKLILKRYGSLSKENVYDCANQQIGKRGAEAVVDNCNIITLCLEEGASGVKGVEAILYGMFPKDRPKTPHLTLCTIHKSKGLEADNIYLLDTERMPKDAADKRNVGQEGNLMYVAITRAKRSLYYVV